MSKMTQSIKDHRAAKEAREKRKAEDRAYVEALKPDERKRLYGEVLATMDVECRALYDQWRWHHKDDEHPLMPSAIRLLHEKSHE